MTKRVVVNSSQSASVPHSLWHSMKALFFLSEVKRPKSLKHSYYHVSCTHFRLSNSKSKLFLVLKSIYNILKLCVFCKGSGLIYAPKSQKTSLPLLCANINHVGLVGEKLYLLIVICILALSSLNIKMPICHAPLCTSLSTDNASFDVAFNTSKHAQGSCYDCINSLI